MLGRELAYKRQRGRATPGQLLPGSVGEYALSAHSRLWLLTPVAGLGSREMRKVYFLPAVACASPINLHRMLPPLQTWVPHLGTEASLHAQLAS